MMRFRLGAAPLEVCRVIVTNNPIETIELVRHKVEPNWSQKYTQSARKAHLMEAFAVRPMKHYRYSRREFLRGAYKGILERLSGDEVLSVVSKVKARGGKAYHMPLVNFHTEDPFGLKQIDTALGFVCKGRRGALLRSGRFYHYYGDFLLSQREWEAFLGMFLIPVHLVHPSYVGHALKYGFNTLRLTSGTKYKPETPKVIETFR